MAAPYLPRIVQSQTAERVMFPVAVVALFSLLVGSFSDNRYVMALGGFSAVIMISFALLRSVGTALEFHYWRRWASKHVRLTDRYHTFTKVDCIDEKRMWFGLTPEAEAWVKANCRGRVVIVPEIDPMWMRVIAFSDPDDAFHFKMRWM